MARSAQDFIRALKAPADPPQPGGLTKLATARAAWDDAAFYVPNKDEAIAEWLLGRLLRERNTAFDHSHWTLLRDVLTGTHKTSSRSLKTWIQPLLHRTPLSPIVVSVLDHLAQGPHDHDSALVLPFSQTVSILWPFAVVKFSAETLLECFSAVLRFFGTPHRLEPYTESEGWAPLLRLGHQIIVSYRHSTANSSNKKKIFSSFMEHQTGDWIQCIALENGSSPHGRILVDVYEAGIETLFNADALRQIQDREDTLYPRTFSQLLVSHPVTFCQSLPRLFKAFIHAVRKHRASVFGQSSHQAPGSSAEHARLAALRFFAMCDSVLSGTEATELVLQTRVDLLKLLDTEGIYGINNEPVDGILRRSGDDAITLLAARKTDGHTFYALSILSTITRIDYDLLSQHVPSVLPHLLTVTSSVQPAFDYLDLILDYHSKTRTLDMLTDALLKACKPHSWLSNENDFHAAYRSAASSSILEQRYLGNLSRLVSSFLTPGQILSTAASVMRQLRETLESCTNGSLGDSGEKRPRKKRKSETGDALPRPEWSETGAVAFALQSRIASAVLSALPTRFLQEEVHAAVRSSVQEFYDSLRPVIKDALKQSRGGDGGNWASHLIVSSALRLKYVLRTSPTLRLSTEGDEKLSSKLLSSTTYPALLSELRVEVLRTLLADSDLGHCPADAVYDATLDFLDASQGAVGLIWSGGVHELGDNAQAGIAVAHILLDRWLPQFDAKASQDQLQRLAKFITSPHLQRVANSSEQGLSVPTILHRSLHNAELWELPRLRDALLEQIDSQTRSLADIDIAKALTPLGKNRSKSTHQISPLVIATYGLLMYIPMEYLTRTVRADLVRRAIAADIALVMNGADHETCPFLREYLRRVYAHSGQVDQATADPYLLFLLQHTPALSTCSEGLVQTTLELIRMHLSFALKAVIKRDKSALNQVIEYLSGDADDDLRAHSLILLVDLLAVDHKPQAFEETTLDQFTSLQRHFLGALEPRIAASDLESHENASGVLRLRLWDRLLVFQTWLGLDAGQVPRLGGLLVHKLLSSKSKGKEYSQAYVATLAIVQQECQQGVLGHTGQHMEIVLASYLAFRPMCDQKERQELDTLMGTFSRKLSQERFADLLSLMMDALSNPGLSLKDLANLLLVDTMSLQNAPEGSSKVTQAHFSSCVRFFAARPQFLQEADLQRKALHFIASQINNRPAAVRQQDLSSIWSFISTSLEGSSSHHTSTHKPIFHEIVSILSGLIRLRRDLITPTLPHLGHALRRLIKSLRHIRPNLGAKQTKMVADTLPRFINTADPLSVEEAKAVARLLTTMTTKTVVRGQSSGESDKAESLARPFSKHAAYVLVAYVEALNDPLCVLPQDTRRELEPGLFALCDMMGEYNRDAMMVASLDAAGKVVMKGIWREYEKQKYVGKG